MTANSIKKLIPIKPRNKYAYIFCPSGANLLITGIKNKIDPRENKPVLMIGTISAANTIDNL